MPTLYDEIATAVAAHGMAMRGGFVVAAGDAVPAVAPGKPAITVMMIGNTGRAMWSAFDAQRRLAPNPLDRWVRAIIAPIAAEAGARAVYPDETPPLPFQRWASRAWPLHASPLGLLIDTEYGLWHALRAALLFPVARSLPSPPARPSPCATCADQPCLSACPVVAFTAAGFDHRSCRRHLATEAGDTCLAAGCRSRVACPVGAEHRYGPAQLQFHQRAFSGVARRIGSGA